MAALVKKIPAPMSSLAALQQSLSAATLIPILNAATSENPIANVGNSTVFAGYVSGYNGNTWGGFAAPVVATYVASTIPPPPPPFNLDLPDLTTLFENSLL